jgi:hypothetical protein
MIARINPRIYNPASRPLACPRRKVVNHIHADVRSIKRHRSQPLPKWLTAATPERIAAADRTFLPG